MNLNKLLASLAAGILMTVTSHAVPGYVQINIVKGVNTIANPFADTSRYLDDILPVGSGVPDGSVVYVWNSDKGFYDLGGTFYEGIGWLNTSFEMSMAQVDAYTGAILVSPRNAQLKLLQTHTADSLGMIAPKPLVTGMQLRSVPAGLTIEDACLGTKDGDTIVLWNAAEQSFGETLTCIEYESGQSAWFTAEFQMVKPAIAPGVAFFYNHK